MRCRSCNTEANNLFVDLGHAPLSNSFLSLNKITQVEYYYPQRVYVCTHCWLTQIDEYECAESIFSNEYVYFSSYSKSWVQHAYTLVQSLINRFNLDNNSFVAEIASNDGYLLQHFIGTGIKTLGIEPAANTAAKSKEKGIHTVCDFFSESLAHKLAKGYGLANVIIGNNVLAHVPKLSDFVKGLKVFLAPGGVISIEVPHILKLIEQNQFDTIYHEHFSYFSLHALKTLFEKQGLEIFDVDEIPSHGGSLRIFIKSIEDKDKAVQKSVERLLTIESNTGILSLSFYQDFSARAQEIKYNMLEFLLSAKRDNKTVVGYGAAAKANTLLNFMGIKSDLIEFIADASPHKQGMFTPGAHIPVVTPDRIMQSRPDYIIIFPWNLELEIMEQLAYVKEWNAKFVIPIPKFKVI